LRRSITHRLIVYIGSRKEGRVYIEVVEEREREREPYQKKGIKIQTSKQIVYQI